MGTNKEPLNPEDGTIYTADGQRVDYINDISDLLWRFDDAKGEWKDNPDGPHVDEPKRVHDLESLRAAVSDWKDEAAAPWAGYKPHPEYEGEVCTEITTNDIISSDMEAVAVQFTRCVNSGGDVHVLSAATVLLSVCKPGTIAAALAWGEGPRGFTASLGRAEVKDNNRAVAYALDQVYVMVQRTSSAPDTHDKHAWMVACRAADMMVSGLVHGGDTSTIRMEDTNITIKHTQFKMVFEATLALRRMGVTAENIKNGAPGNAIKTHDQLENWRNASQRIEHLRTSPLVDLALWCITKPIMEDTNAYPTP